MDLSTQRGLLTIASCGCLVLAAGSVVWSLGGVHQQPPPSTADNLETVEADATSTEPQVNENSPLRVDYSLALQKPLYDPPKPVKKDPPIEKRPPAPPPPKRAPRLDWTLAGTIIQGKRSVAILSDSTGKTDIRSAGETVDLEPGGVLVRRVESDQVMLEIDGRKSTLQLNKSFESTGDARNNRGVRRRNR